MDALNSLEQLSSLTPIDSWNYLLLQMVHARMNAAVLDILKHVHFSEESSDAG